MDDVFVTESELDDLGLKRTRRAHLRFQRQELRHFMRFASSFRRYNGVKLLVTLGILLIVLGG